MRSGRAHRQWINGINFLAAVLVMEIAGAGKMNSGSPRIIKAKAIAARLGHSVNWFYAHYKELLLQGFPSKDDLLGGWDADAIEAWLDRRRGMSAKSSIAAAEEKMLDLIRGTSCETRV